MTAKKILADLKALGNESYVKIFRRHGITGPVFGVKVEELKKIQMREKKNYQLALDLYDTGVYDAMYLAGRIADDAKMSKKDLNHWLEKAGGGAICNYSVAWVAAGSKHGRELALKWIDSKKPEAASTGWSTLGSLVSIQADPDLNLPELKKLLQRVEKAIHAQPDRVRSAMNLFVIAVGTYVRPLREAALASAEKIGEVSVDVGDTACKVPFAPDYSRKCIQRNPTAKKRKTAKC